MRLSTFGWSLAGNRSAQAQLSHTQREAGAEHPTLVSSSTTRTEFFLFSFHLFKQPHMEADAKRGSTTAPGWAFKGPARLQQRPRNDDSRPVDSRGIELSRLRQRPFLFASAAV